MLRDYRWSMAFVVVLLIVYTMIVFLGKKNAHSHEPASASAATAVP